MEDLMKKIQDQASRQSPTDTQWKEDSTLPEYFCGKDGGLQLHKAVAIKEGKRVKKVVCLGGYVDTDLTKHPSHILEFTIPS